MNQNSDINGSAPGSLIKGIKRPPNVPVRSVNPLNPAYQIPGGKEEPVDYKKDPYGYEGCSMTVNLQKKRRDSELAVKKPPRPTSKLLKPLDLKGEL